MAWGLGAALQLQLGLGASLTEKAARAPRPLGRLGRARAPPWRLWRGRAAVGRDSPTAVGSEETLFAFYISVFRFSSRLVPRFREESFSALYSNEPGCSFPGRKKTPLAVSGFSWCLFLSVRRFEIPQKSQSIISQWSQIPWHSSRVSPRKNYFLMQCFGNRTSLNLSTLPTSEKHYSECSPERTLWNCAANTHCISFWADCWLREIVCHSLSPFPVVSTYKSLALLQGLFLERRLWWESWTWFQD